MIHHLRSTLLGHLPSPLLLRILPLHRILPLPRNHLPLFHHRMIPLLLRGLQNQMFLDPILMNL